MIKWWYEKIVETVNYFNEYGEINLTNYEYYENITGGFIWFSIYITLMFLIMLPLCIIGEILTLPCQFVGYIVLLIVRKKGDNNE